jgi:hypothetical protein
MDPQRIGGANPASRRRSQADGNSEPRVEAHARLAVSDLALTLRGEHAHVRSIIERLLVNDAADDHAELWHELYAELLSHTDAEQEMVYRPLLDEPSMRAQTEAAIDEHDDIRQTLDDIEGMTPGGAQFLARLDRLRYTVERHVRDEEEQLLPLAERVFDASTLEAMAHAFAQRKQALLEARTAERAYGGAAK